MYDCTINEIEHRIKENFPHTKPDDKASDDTIEHLLYMIEQIKGMKDSEIKLRWIIWFICASRFLGIISLEEIRNLIREDVENNLVLLK